MDNPFGDLNIKTPNDMSDKQELFDLFSQEHDLILLDGELNDIIEEVKKHIEFERHVKEAYTQGVRSEYDHHVYCSGRIYLNGEDYFSKTFKKL